MKFSLILNSRGRVPQFVNFINSVFETTRDVNNIEILVRIDKDDSSMLDFYERQLKPHPYQNMLFLVGERPKNLHVSLNYLAKHSVGQYIFVLNDDVLLDRKDWDTHAFSKLESSKGKDGIIYGRTHDNSVDKPPGSEYASFPIISRAGYETLGFVMHNDFVGLGGDNSIFKVYNSVGKVVDLPDVKIDHVFHNSLSKVFQPDATAYHMRTNTGKNYVDPETLDISKDVEKLRKRIQECPV